MREASTASLIIGVLLLVLFLPMADKEKPEVKQKCHEEMIGASRIVVCVNPFWYHSVKKDSLRMERVFEIQDSLMSEYPQLYHPYQK